MKVEIIKMLNEDKGLKFTPEISIDNIINLLCERDNKQKKGGIMPFIYWMIAVFVYGCYKAIRWYHDGMIRIWRGNMPEDWPEEFPICTICGRKVRYFDTTRPYNRQYHRICKYRKRK